MEINYQLTQRDFFESFIAHRSASPLRKWLPRFVSLFVFGLLGLGLLGEIVHPYPNGWSNLMPLFIIAAAWLFLFFGSPRLSARKQFLKQPKAQGPRRVLLDSDGIHWRWEGGSSDLEWGNQIRFVESKNQFLIYTSPACFSIVPKRGLAPDQLEELRTILSQNIPPNR